MQSQPKTSIFQLKRHKKIQLCGLIGWHHWHRSEHIALTLRGVRSVSKQPRTRSRLGTFRTSRSACVRLTGAHQARCFNPGQICVVATVTLRLAWSDVGCRLSFLVACRFKAIA